MLPIHSHFHIGSMLGDRFPKPFKTVPCFKTNTSKWSELVLIELYSRILD